MDVAGLVEAGPGGQHGCFLPGNPVLVRADRPASDPGYLDILHVATALPLGAIEFLTFDVNQRKLAAAADLTARP